ncbi:hypothetical protein [Saccharothrix syringae]|nr:hypothetical protein [Saccharothrix syringae]
MVAIVGFRLGPVAGEGYPPRSVVEADPAEAEPRMRGHTRITDPG